MLNYIFIELKCTVSIGQKSMNSNNQSKTLVKTALRVTNIENKHLLAVKTLLLLQNEIKKIKKSKLLHRRERTCYDYVFGGTLLPPILTHDYVDLSALHMITLTCQNFLCLC